MCIFIRHFDGKDFKEELLALIPLEGLTTGAIIFGTLEELFQKHGLSFEKVNLAVTDGAPAMIGRNRGLVSRIKAVAPSINTRRCLIHQIVLWAKLSGDLKEVMDKTMKIINFIRWNSSTQHRLFQNCVQESETSHDDLLLHKDVHWLSKGTEAFRWTQGSSWGKISLPDLMTLPLPGMSLNLCVTRSLSAQVENSPQTWGRWCRLDEAAIQSELIDIQALVTWRLLSVVLKAWAPFGCIQTYKRQDKEQMRRGRGKEDRWGNEGRNTEREKHRSTEKQEETQKGMDSK